MISIKLNESFKKKSRKKNSKHLLDLTGKCKNGGDGNVNIGFRSFFLGI
jgi:hypothetical protein